MVNSTGFSAEARSINKLTLVPRSPRTFRETSELINRSVDHVRREVAAIKSLVAAMGDNPDGEQLEALRRHLDGLMTDDPSGASH